MRVQQKIKDVQKLFNSYTFKECLHIIYFLLYKQTKDKKIYT